MSPDRQALANHLDKAGIRFVQTNCWHTDDLEADLVWACDPVAASLVPDTMRIVGQRTLNRKTRLDAVLGAGASVVPYAAPCDDMQFSEMLAQWDVAQAVVKFDWSYQRAGVFLWPAAPTQNPKLPSGFDPSCDIIMRRHIGAADTLKVDAFAGHILGASVLKTQAIGLPNWRELKDDGHVTVALDPETERMLSAVSRALVSHGVGYASFDLMQGPDGARIIEVNTSGVGTRIWQSEPEPYARKLAAALAECIAQPEQFPLFGELRIKASQNNNDAEAPELSNPSIAPETEPEEALNLEDVIEDMTRSVEALPEAERVSIADETYASLLVWAGENIPYYAARDDKADPSPISRSEVQQNTPSLIARSVPKQFGRIEPAYCGGTTQPPLALCRTRFAHLIDLAVQRRALRWAGVADAGPIQRLLGQGTSQQGGLSADMDPNALADRLHALGRQALWSRPSVLVRLALSIGQDRARALPISGILSSHEPLGAGQKAFLEDQFGTAVAETYHLGSAGPIGIRCQNCWSFHLMTDTTRIEVLTPDGARAPSGTTGSLVVTSLYDLAMPLLRFDTADQAYLEETDAHTCGCGTNFPRTMLLGRTKNAALQEALLKLHDAMAPAALGQFSTSGLWQLSAESSDRITLTIDRELPLCATESVSLSAYLSTITDESVVWTIKNAPLWEAARSKSHLPVLT